MIIKKKHFWILVTRSTGFIHNSSIKQQHKLRLFAAIVFCFQIGLVLSCKSQSALNSKDHIETKSGLKSRVIKKGTGEKAEIGDIVLLYETTSYRDGTVLYSNENSSTPVKITLGKKMVTQAVEEALLGMRTGEIKQIIAPPYLVKREIYPHNVSPDSTLVIKLIAHKVLKGNVIAANGNNITITNLDTFIKKQMSRNKIPGLSFALINNDEVVYKKSFGYEDLNTQKPVTNQTIFEAASMSKAVFAYFTMLKVEQNTIDLDTPIYRYFPEPLLEDQRYKKITTRMVLSHTSGLPNWRFFNENGQLDIKFTPGTDFHYSGEGYEYLAKALAYIYNTDDDGLDSIIAKEVYEPLEMNSSGFRLTEKKLNTSKATGYEDGAVSNGIPSDLAKPYFGASFKFHTTIDDFSKWMVAVLKVEQLKQETRDELFHKQIELPEDESLRNENGFDSWGLGFMRAETSQGPKLAHGGMNPSFQCYFMLLPKKKFGFAFFGNSNTVINIVPELEDYLMTGTKK